MDCCVIGIGTFGFNVAKTLVEAGNKVLAIDSDISAIRAIKEIATNSICLKVFDEESLREIGIGNIEIVVIGIGDNFEDSIMLTALLKKKFSISTVICRAVNSQHKEILHLIGADHVVLPEEDAGIKLADKICTKHRNFNRIAQNFSSIFIKVNKKWIGKKLSEIDDFNNEVVILGKKLGMNIKKIKDGDLFKQDDIILIAGENEYLEKIINI